MIEALSGTGIKPDKLLRTYAKIVRDLEPTDRAFLHKRGAMQMKIDDW